MKNDKQVYSLVEKIKICTKNFLDMPNQCAYTDSIVGLIISYGKELEQLTEEGSDES